MLGGAGFNPASLAGRHCFDCFKARVLSFYHPPPHTPATDRTMSLVRFLLTATRACLLVAASTGLALAQDSMLRLHTTQGLIDIRLYNTAAPRTVANFMGYVNSGAYANTFFHRSAPGFVIQGGGWSWPAGSSSLLKTPAGPPVANEYSPTRSNLRGTVAMAKIGSLPDSATTEWFVSLANNAAILDGQNGGFSVFGKVTTSGMAVFDAIARLRIATNYASPFDSLPLQGTVAASLTPANLVTLTSVAVLPSGTAASDSDRVFNYLEAAYPQYIAPAGAASTTGSGYYYRYYAATNSYVGTKDGQIFYLVPTINNDINLLGELNVWLATAAAEGY